MTEQPAPGLTVRAYGEADAAAWEGLVARSCNGTFLHTRLFISYHRDRFADRSLVIEDRRGKVVGVLPAAQDRADPELVASHPGLTYGGVVHDGSLRGAAMISALGLAAGHYRDLGYRRLRYKAIPSIYHGEPAEDDLYALFRLGARRYRCDLSATIDLANRGKTASSRAQRRRKAEAAGVTIEVTWEEIAGFWRVLEENLARRHGAAPVHSLDEINMLYERFPDDIMLVAAKVGDTVVGGTVLFSAGPVLHSQYTATSEQGRATFAVDPIYDRAIELGLKRGSRYFDFGTSTVDEGRTLNQDLYQFKVSFGAGGAVYDHYELDLSQPG
jgi:CelD/BcsL family acetyltransferase involved in cellulose biosynthesis